MGVIGREPAAAPLTSSGINDGIVTEADLEAATRNTLVSGRKNWVINGGFDIWQRGTSGTAIANVYAGPDRWRWLSTSGSWDFSQITTGLPSGAKYGVSMTINRIGPDITDIVRQTIEDLQGKHNGENVTISFWAKSAGSATLNVDLNDSTESAFNLTPTWTKYSFTTTVTSSAFDPHAYLDFSIRTDNGQVDLTLVQLELGDTATDFEHRHVRDELALCQRYYEKSYNVDTLPGTALNFGGVHQSAVESAFRLISPNIQFSVAKRIIPSIVLYNTNNGTTGSWSRYNAASAFQANETVDGINQGTGGFGVASISGSLNTTAGHYYMGHWTAEAEL